MTAGRTIYLINQLPMLVKAWRELNQMQKRAVINACQDVEDADEDDVERILTEVADGQSAKKSFALKKAVIVDEKQ